MYREIPCMHARGTARMQLALAFAVGQFIGNGRQAPVDGLHQAPGLRPGCGWLILRQFWRVYGVRLHSPRICNMWMKAYTVLQDEGDDARAGQGTGDRKFSPELGPPGSPWGLRHAAHCRAGEQGQLKPMHRLSTGLGAQRRARSVKWCRMVRGTSTFDLRSSPHPSPRQTIGNNLGFNLGLFLIIMYFNRVF